MKFIKTSLILFISLLLLTSCAQPENNEGNDTSASVAESVAASKSAAETTAPTDVNDNPKGIIKTVKTDFAQNFFILENGNVLLVRQPTRSNPITETTDEDGWVAVYDSEIKEKLAYAPISFEKSRMVFVQIVKDGFAVIDANGNFITLYDNNGKETKTINPPVYDSVSYAVSYDKARIAYCYSEPDTSTDYFCTDSIDLNDKKEIMIFEDTDEIGALKSIGRIFSYRNGIIAFRGTTPTDNSSESKSAEVYGRCNDNGENLTFEKLSKETNFTEFLNTNFLPQENYFVVLEDYMPEPGIPSSGTVKYQKHEGGEINSFTCEDTEENHFAAISGGGKYIATFIYSSDFKEDCILKIYDTDSGTLLHTEGFDPYTSYFVSGISFDENERMLYIFFGEEIDIVGF